MGKFRMYSLVLRQLSPIQKGIQSAHSIFEYDLKFSRTAEFSQWSHVDKTIIVLDGGTYPEMKEDREFLRKMNIPYAIFNEPGLGGITTSISFIAEDKIWDSVEYPVDDSFDIDLVITGQSDEPDWLTRMGGVNNLMMRRFLRSKRLSI